MLASTSDTKGEINEGMGEKVRLECGGAGARLSKGI